MVIGDWSIHLIHRFAVPLEVNCREAAREATLGCPLKGKVSRALEHILKFVLEIKTKDYL